MNKNIVTTLIAAGFFAASAVAPAFAGNLDRTADPALVNVVSGQQPAPDFDISERLEQLVRDLPLPDGLADRLGELDSDILKKPLPEVLELPELERLPDIVRSPVPIPKPVTPAAEAESKVPEPKTAWPTAVSTSGTRALVIERHAEKAEILAAHNGERRAAKADLKAAQGRFVESVKAQNRGRSAKADDRDAKTDAKSVAKREKRNKHRGEGRKNTR